MSFQGCPSDLKCPMKSAFPPPSSSCAKLSIKPLMHGPFGDNQLQRTLGWPRTLEHWNLVGWPRSRCRAVGKHWPGAVVEQTNGRVDPQVTLGVQTPLCSNADECLVEAPLGDGSEYSQVPCGSVNEKSHQKHGFAWQKYILWGSDSGNRQKTQAGS